MRAEKQMCPCRGGSALETVFAGPTDYWVRNRWGTWLERWWVKVAHSDNEVNGFVNYALHRVRWWLIDHELPTVAKLLPSGWTFGGTRWPEAYSTLLMPRSCSFCGSSHPVDVMRLLAMGWRTSICDNRVKCYVAPPRGPSPVPPVKVKTCHCDADQIIELNLARYVWDPKERKYK